MQRISTETDGHFKNGVRGVQRGTKFNAEWCNAVQEEIATFIETAGIALDASNNSQLYAALLAILAAGIETGSVTVNNGEITVTGQGGATCRISNGGLVINFTQGGVSAEVSVTANGIIIEGIALTKTGSSGVAVLNVSETVELVKNLIVNGVVSFRNNVSIAEGKKLVGDTEGYHVGNVNGNLTGNSTGTHYGNVRTANIYAIDNNGAIGINAPAVFSQFAHFQVGIVSGFVRIDFTPGYSSILVDSSLYTSMPDGAHVYCLNVSGGVSGVAVSATKFIVLNAGTGVELIKNNGVWYPLAPNVNVSDR